MMILDKIRKAGIIPVVIIEKKNQADRLGRIFVESGLDCVEITLRTDAAYDAIEILRKQYPELTVGAGTVLSIEQAERAIKRGAQFIVSPGSDSKVISYCKEKNICIIPGVMTPSEIQKNLEMGIQIMKFFPSEAAGGINMLKAVLAPYKDIEFMPTGGINQTNVREYLSCENVIACGGSWMVNSRLLSEEKFDDMKALCIEAKDIADSVNK